MSTTQQPVDFPLPPPPDLYHPSPSYAELRAQSPVSRVRLPDGALAWLVMGYAAVRTVMTDRRFSRAAASAPGSPDLGLGAVAAQSILGMDPPEHTRLRKLVAGAFTNRRVTALRPRVEEIVAELLDGMAAKPRPVDLVEHLSLPLPVQVICELLGVPTADRDRFHAWSDAMMGGMDRDRAEIMEGFVTLGAYLAGLIEAKRREPADDLLTALIAARDDDDRLSEFELVNLGVSLLVAGHETTANQLNMCLLTLLHHPEELRRLREDPALLPTAVEELLRFVQLGVGGGMVRVTTEEVELGGVTIPAGEAVIPVGPAANRDPAAFPEPDRLDLTREPNHHLAFGAGVHHCLGAQLARMELEVALGGLLRRFPDIRVVVPDSELRFKQGMILRSLETLPVTWSEP
jgi:cytochrome P450